MKYLRSLLGTLLSACVGLACADSQGNVFGLEIGKPATLPVCQYTAAGKYAGVQPSLCIEREVDSERFGNYSARRIHFPVAETPNWFYNDSIVSGYIDGKLENVYVNTSGYSSKDQALEALVKKYGKPTDIFEQEAQNEAGARYKVFNYKWVLPGLYVEFWPVQSTSLDVGIIRIETPVGKEKRMGYLKSLVQKERSL
ncbi:hypothetical protein QPK29_020650 [Massilia sp. YIM B02787]|uniref:Uncharacterized protein n=2 Tax=Massilia orientalis TaxID=3050128 RepID=A0ACC7MF64_9BURK|nr:hypothetical protein [Massilia sp. YIM B02787]